MKKNIFYFFSIFLFLFIFLIIDLSLSNTILNYKNCFKYEQYYYELKKNCKIGTTLSTVLLVLRSHAMRLCKCAGLVAACVAEEGG